ncbi:histidine kinase [Sphingomonas sabuli]|uniref:Histidine kinase n=1 Tax=Sphingomonas sabuli TaxID=2764186 RepID=A0A7G9L3F9_9SPHN|nr:histidine kinase [Sphingomonas sabuli]QNM83158.1 histidine kinase [Sphingomonas sabuli]
MKPLQHPLQETTFSDWPLAVKTILGFWLFYALTIVIRAFLGRDPSTVLSNKVLTIAAAIVLSFCIYVALASFARGVSIRRRAIVAILASLGAAAAMAAVLMIADSYQSRPQEEIHLVSAEGYEITELGNATVIKRAGEQPLTVTWPRVAELDQFTQLRISADAAVVWLFFFMAWSAFYLAIRAQTQALTAQRRASEAESAAQVAQLRALRYQVNPHFLFNTLNSLSSLVMTGRNDRAEAMLLALSTFFRSSLSLDPAADITLEQEIDLQRLYLEIEKTRFPDRLKVEIDVPPALQSARLPALILQPIVENAIKYGVSKTRHKILISIVAEEIPDGRMMISVSNRLANSTRDELPASTHEGTGVGLTNVCERLQTRFGDRSECRFGPMDTGGFKVILKMPVQA